MAMRPTVLVLEALMLVGLWLVLSGIYQPLYISYGLVVVALVMWLNHRMHRLPLAVHPDPFVPGVIVHRLVSYLFGLVWEMAKAGVNVAYLVLHPKMPLRPMLVTFRSPQPGAGAKTVLGNSITLTPGTLTLDIHGDEYTVHTLTEEAGRDLMRGHLHHKVARLFVASPPRDLCLDANAQPFFQPTSSRP
jgi:multicomponent Na+:H+ antiporter subunit E